MLCYPHVWLSSSNELTENVAELLSSLKSFNKVPHWKLVVKTKMRVIKQASGGEQAAETQKSSVSH